MSTDTPDEPFSEQDGVLYDEQVTPEYGILGFTLRELLIVGAWLIAFVVSFFPVYGIPGTSIWTGITWLLPIGVPTAAVFLIVLRRFSPDGIRRVGSLGIDQFASVAFSVAALVWTKTIWDLVAGWTANGIVLPAWVAWVELVMMAALVVLTVFAPLVPGLREDFRGRLVTLAHRNANPVRPVIARPRPERPVAPVPADDAPADVDADDDADDVTDAEDADAPAARVALTEHASGGALGTIAEIDDDYVPGYARSRREADDEDETAQPTVAFDEALDQTDAPIADAEVSQDAELPDDAADIPDADVFDAGIPDAADVPEEGTADSDAVHDDAPDDLSIFDETTVIETVAEDPIDPVDDHSAFQPFWALAPTERDVHDDLGRPLFRIGPDAWALVIEDRGGAYVIRHDDGRIGYLHDIEDITKG